MNLQIESDVKQVYTDLTATKYQAPRTNKKMVTAAVTGGRTRARQAVYKNGIKRETGDLRTKTVSKTWKAGADVEGYIVNRSAQASNLEFGGTIQPKRKDFLIFDIDGQIVKVKSVTIPGGRLGFFSTLDGYFASSEPIARMTKVLTRDLEKIWGKVVK